MLLLWYVGAQKQMTGVVQNKGDGTASCEFHRFGIMTSVIRDARTEIVATLIRQCAKKNTRLLAKLARVLHRYKDVLSNSKGD